MRLVAFELQNAPASTTIDVCPDLRARFGHRGSRLLPLQSLQPRHKRVLWDSPMGHDRSHCRDGIAVERSVYHQRRDPTGDAR